MNVNASLAGIDHRTPSSPMNLGIMIVSPAPKIISRIIESPAERKPGRNHHSTVNLVMKAKNFMSVKFKILIIKSNVKEKSQNGK